MTLKYHQAVFDLMAKKPRPSKAAVAALEERERAMGITLPASLKEFYSLHDACAILTEHSNQDQTVPIEKLGDPEELAHGVIRISDENQGVAAWYVRLDGSDDPPVEVECEGYRREPPEGVEDYSLWDVAEFHRVADRFSAFIYERVLTYGGGKQERQVAAKLKPFGGEVDFDERGQAVTVRFPAPRSFARDKSPAKPFDAVAAMGLVRTLDRLQCLEIRTAKVGAGGWGVLRDHPGIVRLEDSGSLDDAAVKHVIAMPALRELSVSNGRLTDAGLARLLREHPFESLSINASKKLTALGLAALEAQTGLQRLSLYGWGGDLTDLGLAGLAGLASLCELDIDSALVSDDGLRHLAGLSRLTRLWLHLDAITDAGLVHLAGLTSLTNLRIWRTARVCGAGLRHLSALHKVRELDVRGLPITDESLVHLSGFEDLEDLNLRETKVVGPGFQFLSGLSRLRKLDCGHNGFIDEGMPHLARLSSLERIDVAGARITDAGLRALAPLRSLQTLIVTRANVSAAAIRDLKAAIPGLSSVRWTPPGSRPGTDHSFDFHAKAGEE